MPDTKIPAYQVWAHFKAIDDDIIMAAYDSILPMFERGLPYFEPKPLKN